MIAPDGFELATRVFEIQALTNHQLQSMCKHKSFALANFRAFLTHNKINPLL